MSFARWLFMIQPSNQKAIENSKLHCLLTQRPLCIEFPLPSIVQGSCKMRVRNTKFAVKGKQRLLIKEVENAGH